MELENILIKFIVTLLLAIFTNTIILLSYYISDKKNGVKKKKSIYIFIFLFGILYVIYDFFKRLFSKNHKKPDKVMMKVTCISLAVHLVFNIAIPRMVFPDLYNLSFSHIYYDKYGNSYDSLEKVVYYTEDGCQFLYDDENLEFNCIEKSNNKGYSDSYSVNYTYLDKNGYLVFPNHSLELIENDASHKVFSWYDNETNEYYTDAEFARWDSEGNLRIE